MGSGSDLVTTYRTGRVWNVPVDLVGVDPRKAQLAQVMTPASEKLAAPVADGVVRFFGGTAGVYRIDVAGQSVAVAANLADPSESDIAPVAELTLGGKRVAGVPEFTASVTRSIWVKLALAVLALLLLEWWTYNRRVTV
jgi:hypothetical protein